MKPSPIDFSSFFEDGQEGECRPLKPAMVRVAEESLGYRLPKAYINLLMVCNGGALKRCAFLMPKSEDDIQRVEYFHNVNGIGKEKGINGRYGSRYLIKEWDYPDVGIVISSDGHTPFMLDYSECGFNGEPRVILVDVELDDDAPYVDVVAPDFESFLKMLRAHSDFYTFISYVVPPEISLKDIKLATIPLGLKWKTWPHSQDKHDWADWNFVSDQSSLDIRFFFVNNDSIPSVEASTHIEGLNIPEIRTTKGARVLHLMVPEMFREKAMNKLPEKIRDWKLMPHQTRQKPVG